MLIPALIIVLTGLVWAFEQYNSGIIWALNKGKTIQKNEKLVSDITQSPTNCMIDKIYNTTRQLYPEAKSYFIFLPEINDSLATVETFITYANRFDDVVIQFDQYTTKILKTTTYHDKNNGEKFQFINYDLHIGRILGIPGKIIAFIASLVSASLPVTGFLIWWGRNKKKKKQ